jgi:hypothetical protein
MKKKKERKKERKKKLNGINKVALLTATRSCLKNKKTRDRERERER